MTDAMRAAVQQAEIATELSVLSATSRGRRLYELAREAGRRIFIISDMYLRRRSPGSPRPGTTVGTGSW